MTEARSRARIRLAAEQAGWELDRSGLTDIYRRGTRRVIVTYDLHDGVVCGWRRSGSEVAQQVGRDADRVLRLLDKPRWTTTD